jgi:hypothetical protein
MSSFGFGRFFFRPCFVSAGRENHCSKATRRPARVRKPDFADRFPPTSILAAVTSGSASPRLEKCLCIVSPPS